jgi:hypothetical protein
VDLDGDGRLDILTGSVAGNISIYRRRANGSYAVGEYLRFKRGGVLMYGRGTTVAAADWRGKAIFDLIIGNADGAVVLVPNEGTPQKPAFGPTERLQAGGLSISAEGGNAAPFVADWDGDGLPDLILGSGSGKVVWYRNVGTKGNPQLAAPITLVEPLSKDGRLNLAASETPTRSGGYARVCVADWNGDGRPDLIVGDYSYTPPGNRLHGWVWVYLRSPVAVADAPKTQARAN